MRRAPIWLRRNPKTRNTLGDYLAAVLRVSPAGVVAADVDEEFVRGIVRARNTFALKKIKLLLSV